MIIQKFYLSQFGHELFELMQLVNRWYSANMFFIKMLF